MRQILRINVRDVALIGTYHKPDAGAAAGRHEGASGILLVNFGQFDRAGPANLAVDIAEHLCDHGYPVFRFDMPGLGDTPGGLPEYFGPYWRFVEQGGQVPWTVELAAALKRQYGLHGLILGGLCGGAITAILAGEALRADLLGLLLLDPPVLFSPTLPAASDLTLAAEKPRPRAGVQAQLHRICESVRSKARNSRWVHPLRNARSEITRIIDGLMRFHYPPTANLPMIRCWQRLCASGLPMLVLCASGSHERLIQNKIFPAAFRRKITLLTVQTNHLFSSGGGKQVVLNQLDEWMAVNFAISLRQRQ